MKINLEFCNTRKGFYNIDTFNKVVFIERCEFISRAYRLTSDNETKLFMFENLAEYVETFSLDTADLQKKLNYYLDTRFGNPNFFCLDTGEWITYNNYCLNKQLRITAGSNVLTHFVQNVFDAFEIDEVPLFDRSTILLEANTADGFTCSCCTKTVTKDRITVKPKVPISKGGTYNNYAVTCMQCADRARCQNLDEYMVTKSMPGVATLPEKTVTLVKIITAFFDALSALEGVSRIDKRSMGPTKTYDERFGTAVFYIKKHFGICI
jgi:hypothetical protein